MHGEPLLTFKSHIDGKNSDVLVYPDRLEWVQPRSVSKGKLIGGMATGGLSLLATGVKGKKAGSEVIAIKAVSSVITERDGMRFTKVRVICTGNTIDFRVSHGDAGPVKDLIMSLVLGSHPSLHQGPGGVAAAPITHAGSVAPPPPPDPAAAVHSALAPPPPPAPVTGVAAELKELAELRDAGVLTEAEFAAQKARLLGG